MPVSASVMVTSQTRITGDEQELEVLILWRGTPGWWTIGDSGSSGGRGSSDGSWSHRFSEGGKNIEISGNYGAHTANVLGRTFDLTKGNAILVDEIDSPGGPRIVGAIMVDSRLPNGGDPNQILMLLGRVKELREYLRCDASAPNGAIQTRLAPMCALVLSQ